VKKKTFVNPNIEKEAFYENKFYFAVFDIHPVSPGHTIIVPKRNITNLVDLNERFWYKLQPTINEVIKAIEHTDLKKLYKQMIESKITINSVLFCKEALEHPCINTKPDAYNQGINDGSAAGRTADQLHWHIIPRYENDVEDPRGGIRYVIPSKGNYNIPRK
jgi:diadenosine tetraphosphate (Ap4A) HIT family hydrolase